MTSVEMPRRWLGRDINKKACVQGERKHLPELWNGEELNS